MDQHLWARLTAWPFRATPAVIGVKLSLSALVIIAAASALILMPGDRRKATLQPFIHLVTAAPTDIDDQRICHRRRALALADDLLVTAHADMAAAAKAESARPDDPTPLNAAMQKY